MSDRKERAPFEIGDCIILNEIERPSADTICVIVGKDGDYWLCAYLNDDRRFDPYCNPPMRNKLERATRIEEFGVGLVKGKAKYWVQKTGESSATYPCGEPRIWQERFRRSYSLRKSVWLVALELFAKKYKAEQCTYWLKNEESK